MDRDTLRPVVLALLCVLAIGAAAATLDSTVSTDSGGGFGIGPSDAESGASSDDSGTLGDRSGPVAAPISLPCFPVLNEPWVLALILAGFALGGYAAYRRFGGLGVVAYVGPVGIPLVFVHALLTACSTSASGRTEGILPGRPDNASLPDGGSGAAGPGSGTTLTDPSVLLLLGLGVALVAAVALLFVSSGDDPEPDESLDGPEPTQDVAAVGRAAGEAADRIEESTDVANEVYRAWREMTRHLDVSNPRSSTPSEFASAAVEAGMAREDVDELTALFEEVRYGGESPTDERERRALDALRNIEREYADGDVDGAAGGGGGADGDADYGGGPRR